MSNAIFIGRFRPFHIGHLSAILQAFEHCPIQSMTILIGSSNRHRSVRNPFTSDEVIEMINTSLPEHIKSRVSYAQIGDHSNDEVWQSEVRKCAENATHLVGYDKDESSYYLKLFPELKLYQPTPYSIGNRILNGTDFRKLYFEQELFSSTYVQHLPSGTINFLDKWASTHTYDDMQQEYRSSIDELNKFKDYPYEGHLNIACADSVVVCAGHVLLVERKYSPGKGCLALPGGHKHEKETFLDAAIRELQEETCIKVPEKVLRGSVVEGSMFDNPNRSYPHTRITMGYCIHISPNPDNTFPRVRAADDALSAKWYALNEVRDMQQRMYDDHYQIIQYFTGI